MLHKIHSLIQPVILPAHDQEHANSSSPPTWGRKGRLHKIIIVERNHDHSVRHPCAHISSCSNNVRPAFRRKANVRY